MWDLALKINFPWNIRNNMSILKLMNHDISIVGVTPYFSTGQILLKKKLTQDKYWHNQYWKAFQKNRWPQIVTYTVTRYL